MKVDIYSASRHESGTKKFCDVAKEDGTACRQEDGTACRHDQQNHVHFLEVKNLLITKSGSMGMLSKLIYLQSPRQRREPIRIFSRNFFFGPSSNESLWVKESRDINFLRNLHQKSFRHLDAKFSLNDIIP